MPQLMQKTPWWGLIHFCIVVGIRQSNKTVESRSEYVRSVTVSGVAGQANTGVTVLPAMSASEI